MSMRLLLYMQNCIVIIYLKCGWENVTLQYINVVEILIWTIMISAKKTKCIRLNLLILGFTFSISLSLSLTNTTTTPRQTHSVWCIGVRVWSSMIISCRPSCLTFVTICLSFCLRCVSCCQVILRIEIRSIGVIIIKYKCAR